MVTKVFTYGKTIATAVVDIELVEGFWVRKVYVHFNYATSHEAYELSPEDSTENDVLVEQIREWCNENKFNLWSY